MSVRETIQGAIEHLEWHGIALGEEASKDKLPPRWSAFELWQKLTEALAQLEEMERDHEATREALKPFAAFACDPPCGCHNCTARTILGASGEET